MKTKKINKIRATAKTANAVATLKPKPKPKSKKTAAPAKPATPKTKKHTIAFYEIEDWEIDIIKKSNLKSNDLIFIREPLDEDNVEQAKKCDILSTFIYSEVNKERLNELKNLKMIATRSTGYDHIDTEEARKRGIVVSNVPFYGENTVAEHTFGLILSVSRNIHRAYVRVQQGNYSLNGLKGIDIKNKTLGVMGCGNIGLNVIRIARGFGMNVIAYDAKEQHLLAEVLGFRYVSIDDLLRNSDIVTLHIPYMPATHHIINRDAFSKMKRGAILINTARGGLVNTKDLLWALEEGILRGAGLDVLEGENLLKDERQILDHEIAQEKLRSLIESSLLIHREDVVFTPHIAFFSQEALQRILHTSLHNIECFFNKNPEYVVNPPKEEICK